VGEWTAWWLTAVLAVLEVSLSFDNAVINAGVLRTMSPLWRQLFLTVGILIAVFGMRLVCPLVIVAVSAGLSRAETVRLALQQPDAYSRVLINAYRAISAFGGVCACVPLSIAIDAYPAITAFGGMFLLQVFLNFLLDRNKETHWLGPLERRLVRAAKFDEISVFIALAVMFSTHWWVP